MKPQSGVFTKRKNLEMILSEMYLYRKISYFIYVSKRSALRNFQII